MPAWGSIGVTAVSSRDVRVKTGGVKADCLSLNLAILFLRSVTFKKSLNLSDPHFLGGGNGS